MRAVVEHPVVARIRLADVGEARSVAAIRIVVVVEVVEPLPAAPRRKRRAVGPAPDRLGGNVLRHCVAQTDHLVIPADDVLGQAEEDLERPVPHPPGRVQRAGTRVGSALPRVPQHELPRRDDRGAGLVLALPASVTDRRAGEAANAGLGDTALEPEVLGSPARVPQGVAALLPRLAAVALAYLQHGEPQLLGEPSLCIGPLAQIVRIIGRDGHQRVDRGLVRPSDDPVPRVAVILVAEQRGWGRQVPVLVPALGQRASPERVVCHQVGRELRLQRHQCRGGQAHAHPDLAGVLCAAFGVPSPVLRIVFGHRLGGGDVIVVGERGEPLAGAGLVVVEVEKQEPLMRLVEGRQDVALDGLRQPEPVVVQSRVPLVSAWSPHSRRTSLSRASPCYSRLILVHAMLRLRHQHAVERIVGRAVARVLAELDAAGASSRA